MEIAPCILRPSRNQINAKQLIDVSTREIEQHENIKKRPEVINFKNLPSEIFSTSIQ